jgi:hypothetical protein
MKYIGMSLALFAFINGADALRSQWQDEDLFTDDQANQDTLASIDSAEKEHGSKFKGIDAESTKFILAEKSNMVFNDDEFVKNDKVKYAEGLL